VFFDNRLQWERDWDEQRLRDDSHLVRAMMGSALHDTVKAIDMTENFGCFPEQWLERVRRLPADYLMNSPRSSGVAVPLVITTTTLSRFRRFSPRTASDSDSGRLGPHAQQEFGQPCARQDSQLRRRLAA
jgi:hypothetical protein